ncbi:oxidoreductase [Luteolibacter pohnpeiensis]|uniref:Oxidoreductase n=1 Tax=Luteolibacter pohnpeiensis TaxID=454153 RepID=A0A934S5M9_9BACT|nr:oxidoreductase [Luteolibacter pohnpeiensis]MBK1882313.1 oxidoreductase [Luteolibacter pohnpeiensis]
MSPKNKTWLITGCSTGFGRELAKAVLAEGHQVAITARDPKQIESLAQGYEDRALVLTLDVTLSEQIAEAVRKTEKHFGGIDVLVNNAGIGYFAGVEESEEPEIRRMFEINFFGLAAMIHAVLPGMRARRSGHIVNISSIGGLTTFPSVVYYNASKFAVEGLSEGLAKEVAPLGIRVTLVEPSGFRTDWAGRSAKESPIEIEDYAETVGEFRRTMRQASGNQPGDPARAADAIIRAVEVEDSPLHLLLGNDAVQLAHEKLDSLRRDFKAWEEISIGADFPNDEA